MDKGHCAARRVKRVDARRKSYKSMNYAGEARSKREADFMGVRNLQRADHILCKRLEDFRCDARNPIEKKQIINFPSGMAGELGLIMRNQTISHILCCTCGTAITPNHANMCESCLRLEDDIIQGLPSRGTIVHCPKCESYLCPPTTWVKTQRESKELLAICLKRLKKLPAIRLVDAKFLFTEPHSKRIKLQLLVQKEVVEKSHTIEYVVVHQMCRACTPADPNHWEAVVQVRQHVRHMRTFFFLEQLIIRHHAAALAVKIKQIQQGVDFFFAKKRDAVKFFDFLCKFVPIKQHKFHKQLVSHDAKCNISRYRFSIPALICPICHEDLIYLPPKISASLGGIGPLVICTKVRNTVTLLDPFTLQDYVLPADQYWRAPFEPLLSSRQLVEYIVLDVEAGSYEVDNTCQRYLLAEVQIARASDFGRNDTIFSLKTHLGHLLKPGDYALGYDLYGANINNVGAERRKASLPDAILIKKKPEKRRQRKSSKASLRKFRSLDMESDGMVEYQQFLKDLEVNPESRFKVSLHDERTNDSSSRMSSAANDEELMTSFCELEDVFAGLELTE